MSETEVEAGRSGASTGGIIRGDARPACRAGRASVDSPLAPAAAASTSVMCIAIRASAILLGV